jgi:hypothetical protein
LIFSEFECELEWNPVCKGSRVGMTRESGFQAKHRVPRHSMGCWCRESERHARTGRLSSQTAWEPLRHPPPHTPDSMRSVGVEEKSGVDETQRAKLRDSRESNRSVHRSFALGTSRH